MEFHDLGKHCSAENCGQQGAPISAAERFLLFFSSHTGQGTLILASTHMDIMIQLEFPSRRHPSLRAEFAMRPHRAPATSSTAFGAWPFLGWVVGLVRDASCQDRKKVSLNFLIRIPANSLIYLLIIEFSHGFLQISSRERVVPSRYADEDKHTSTPRVSYHMTPYVCGVYKYTTQHHAHVPRGHVLMRLTHHHVTPDVCGTHSVFLSKHIPTLAPQTSYRSSATRAVGSSAWITAPTPGTNAQTPTSTT